MSIFAHYLFHQQFMRKFFVLIFSTLLLAIEVHSAFADGKFVGGDISLLPSYVDHGATYFDVDGNPIAQPLQYFGEQGMNAMRVRLFVNPENAPADHKGQGVCQDLEYVKALGKQIKDAGMAFMLDFHYSDTWADPAKQWTPKAWENLSDEQLYDKIYEYTKEVLTALNEAGATPDFIQTGNEISYGMCWGKSTDAASSLKKVYTNNDANWPRFTTLLKRAGAACREVCPEAKIIIHTERVANSGVLKAFYDRMKNYSVDYDIIELSYYPYYHGTLNTLNSALNDLEARFPEKKIMLVEVGYYHDWQPNGVSYDLSSQYPINGEGQKAFTVALLSKLESHPNVCGFFWWWMEANEKGLDWNTQRVTDNWYNAGLFDNQTGRAEPALYVLKNFLIDNAVGEMTIPTYQDTNVYTIDGKQVRRNVEIQNAIEGLPSGIYVTKGKKVIKPNYR